MAESPEDELELLHRKRVVLEQLLLYARQLSRLEGGVEALQQMLTPPGQAGQMNAAIAQFTAQFSVLETAELQKKRQTLDASIAADLSDILKLSRLDHAEFCAKYCQATGQLSATGAIEALEARLLNFRRDAQSNVAIRHLLYLRGVPLQAARLPVTQKEVLDHLAAIRLQETQCRLKLKLQTRQLLDEVETILNSPQYSDEFKREFAPARAALQHNLDLLAQGCSLEELPSTIEALSFDESSLAKTSAAQKPGTETVVVTTPLAVTPPAEAASTISAKIVSAEAITPSPAKRGFWRKLWRWLSTGWDVRWKDME